MNINQGIKCVVCGSKINVRMQAGGRSKNDIRFACPKCQIPINIVIEFKRRKFERKDNFDIKILEEELRMDRELFEYSIENAEFLNEFEDADYSVQCSSEFFTSKNIFNPFNQIRDKKNINEVPFEAFTPFIQARRFFNENDLMAFEEHCSRIYSCIDDSNIFERLNSLYLNKSEYFLSHINEVFKDIKGEVEYKGDDILNLKCIYDFNIRYFNSFLKRGEFSNINTKILRDIYSVKESNNSEFNRMLSYFYKERYLDEYEQRIIKIIDTYIKKFKYLVPAIAVEYLRSDISKEEVYDKYTMRTCTFEDIKDIYLEVYENVIEIYSLFIALNNIMYRTKYDSFSQLKELPGIPKKIANNKKLMIKNFDDFQLLNKGIKLYYMCNDEEFNKYMPKLERFLRNSLGHGSWHYNNINQMINYRTNEVNGAEIHLLKYANECYKIFPKLVYIYKIIIDMKMNYLKNNLEDFD